MARMARLVVPNYPHHVTQRGNRKQKTFFSDEDYLAYTKLLVTAKEKAGVDIWAYCLMPNHVHLIVVPKFETSLSDFFSEAHRRYSRDINLREGWRGHLWQERFHSFVMDERYLFAAVRYVEQNPINAKLCSAPQDWRWSSARAHLRQSDDELVSVRPMLDRIGDWQAYLSSENPENVTGDIKKHENTGRPIGSEDFLDKLELETGLALKKQKTGPKTDN